MDDSDKRGLTQFWEIFTIILCTPKDFKRYFKTSTLEGVNSSNKMHLKSVRGGGALISSIFSENLLDFLEKCLYLPADIQYKIYMCGNPVKSTKNHL